MTDKEILTPIEEKKIQFYNDELVAVRLEDGEIYVPVRRLCKNLGLDWSGQWQRIRRDEVLSESVNRVVITPTRSAGERASEQEMICLPLDLIPGWLFGVQPSRVREDIRPKLIRYRRECFRVLWDAFKTDILPAMDPALAPPAEMTPAEQELARIEALYNLARQHVEM